MAMHAHTGQTRKGILPYVVHPIEVMKTLHDWGVRDEDTLVAALLHDTLEDTNLQPQAIRGAFGLTVHDIVRELTYTGTRPEEKEQYLNGFVFGSIAALVIKVADRLCNVNDFLPDPYAKKYFHKADQVFKFLEMRVGELPPPVGGHALLAVYILKNQLDNP